MSISNPAIVIGVSAVDTAKDVLANTDKKILETAQNVEQSGNRIQSKFREVASNFRANAAEIAKTATGLGAGIAGFATSFDSIQRATVMADRANLVYEKSLERLKEMHEEGKVSAEDYANQQETVRINAERAALAQDNLSDTYVNFLANVPAQLVSFGFAANSIFTMLKVHHATAAPMAAAHAVTYTGALTSMNVANASTAASTSMLDKVMKMTFLTNPVFLAITGIATLIMLVAFNVGGLRDAFYNLGKAIYEFFVQYFKPLADAMKWFYDNVLKPIGDFMGGAGVQTAEAYGGSIQELGVYTQATAQETAKFRDYLLELAEQEIETKEENLLYSDSIGKLGLAVGLTNEKLDTLANYFRDTEREQKQLIDSSFNLVAAVYGVDFALKASNDQLIQMADNLRELQQETRATVSELKTLKAETESDDEDKAGVTYETGKFRATGALAEAKAKYAGLDGGLIKIGDNWRPKNLHIARNELDSASTAMRRFRDRAGAIDTRSEYERMIELQERLDTAKARYAEESIAVQITVNNNTNSQVSADAEVTSSRNRRMRTSRQVLAGAG